MKSPFVPISNLDLSGSVEIGSRTNLTSIYVCVGSLYYGRQVFILKRVAFIWFEQTVIYIYKSIIIKNLSLLNIFLDPRTRLCDKH